MRSRNLKPGFFTNEDLAECSFPARLCFAGLWLLADREGRLEDRPKRIKGELFRFDSIEAEPLLNELEAHGFVERYQIEGASFIQISKFTTHQTPHYSERDSVIKAPQLQESPAHEDAKAAEDSRRTPGVEPSSRGGRNPLNPDSPNPDSLNPDSAHPSPSAPGRKSSAEVEGVEKPNPKTARQKKPKGTVHGFPPGFERFWNAYPRKVKKDSAAKAFAQRKPDTALVDVMVAAIEVQKHCDQWCRDRGQFIPYPATWLNGAQWLDENCDTGGAVGVSPEMADLFRRSTH